MEELQQVWHEASAQLYQQAQQSAGQTAGGPAEGAQAGGPSATGGASNEDVVDADFEGVDDK